MSSTDPSIASHASAAAASARLVTGTVAGRAGAWLFVRSAEGEHRAQIAASCLLMPEDGDSVLLSLTSDLPPPDAHDGMHVLPCHQHVIAVLSRADAARSSVVLPGGVRLATQEGHLRIEGREVHIDATAGLKARTPHLTLEAARGDLRFGHVDASAGSFTGCIGELRLAARQVGTHIGRLVQKLRSSYRAVEELDDLRAGRTRWEVEGHAQLHARQATVLAEGTVKVDGARIDLG